MSWRCSQPFQSEIIYYLLILREGRYSSPLSSTLLPSVQHRLYIHLQWKLLFKSSAIRITNNFQCSQQKTHPKPPPPLFFALLLILSVFFSFLLAFFLLCVSFTVEQNSLFWEKLSSEMRERRQIWGKGMRQAKEDCARFNIQFTTVDMAFFVILYGSNLWNRHTHTHTDVSRLLAALLLPLAVLLPVVYRNRGLVGRIGWKLIKGRMESCVILSFLCPFPFFFSTNHNLPLLPPSLTPVPTQLHCLFPVCISVFAHFCRFSLTCHSADTMKGGLFNVRGQGNMGGG